MAAKGKGEWVRRSASEQRTMLARYAASGQTVAAFCRREGISTASLYRWQALHGKSGEEHADARGERAPAFVDLGALSLPAPGGRRLEVKLDLGEGLVLHLVRG
jgi:transposase-like protein